MIELESKGSKFFQLLKNRARDLYVYATRKDIAGILQFKSSDGRLPVYRNRVYITSVGTSYRNGLLRLGCHRFDKKTSRIIVRWARQK